jgi:uncharacterized membrane protein YhaH (DUF805 family)
MFMGDMGSEFWIFFLIICILNIILFFKIWGMTNDVNSIKKILQGKTVIEEPDDGSGKIILFAAIGVFIIILISFAVA